MLVALSVPAAIWGRQGLSTHPCNGGGQGVPTDHDWLSVCGAGIVNCSQICLCRDYQVTHGPSGLTGSKFWMYIYGAHLFFG